MKFSKLFSSAKGLTLIEVLVSLTILSIILLGIMNFFNQAYSYTNSNQKKTAAVNVARNAASFMEQSSFIQIKTIVEKHPNVTGSLVICDNSGYAIKWSHESSSNNLCKPIIINNISYHVEILPKLDEKYTSYFIPFHVKVNWSVNKKNYNTSVEGAIKSEDLR
ncbi:prepilin-type N-terminal cleavage/methylation domain-containing protein [Niallia sp. NCCP-28]|uniref:type IV pilus modification PilV family protein n=1 Tax=Niallia sp. NCCP-28 TaxID=2934712 RepID=UPI00207FA5E3|nr:prepilin-type N-terminal cleavage/methylation domain-containing protein [Niallia sp. NCCP-28]GKU81452.1 hypothetical protein NCCP28_08480 [Niallia sp. NCCP-28]